jgi:TonB family protein
MRLHGTTLPALATISFLLSSPGAVLADEPDSAALYGTWRWIESANGFSGLRGTPEACGCERLLTLKRSGKYEFVEQDSAHEYVLCSGGFAVHSGTGRDAERQESRTLWVSFEGWTFAVEANQLLTFIGAGTDTISAYPGGPPGFGVDDASTHRFARVRATPESGSSSARRTRLPLRNRPARHEVERFPADSDSVYYDEPPVVTSRVEPTYPIYAREAGIQGEVLLHVLVGWDGRVRNIKVIRGVVGLNDSAMEAMRKWTFKPAVSNKKPVAVWIEIPIQFRL